jgi:hypothetical protein
LLYDHKLRRDENLDTLADGDVGSVFDEDSACATDVLTAGSGWLLEQLVCLISTAGSG